MKERFDFLIAGAGFSGLTVAQQLAERTGSRCLVVDRRDHLGGNSYDHHDAAGVLIHPYGPHYFRSNSRDVVAYLSRFTGWHEVKYRVLSYTDDRYWSFPVNLLTFEQLMGREATEEEFVHWLSEQRVPIDAPANSEEQVLSMVGRELYEKFYRGYTLKQWQRDPKELDASVCARIPVRTNRDDRYLAESFQALPRDGYTALFRKMLESVDPLVEVRLGTDYREVTPHVDYRHLVYTGPIDEYFDNCFGQLPYRSLRFEPESFTGEELAGRESVSGKKGFWQPEMQVNYPNEHDFTRIVEIKHATGQQIDATTIVREYPEDIGAGVEPFYPVPTPASRRQYQKYKALAAAEKDVSFIGRLATYRYYNMDQVVAMALKTAKALSTPGVPRYR